MITAVTAGSGDRDFWPGGGSNRAVFVFGGKTSDTKEGKIKKIDQNNNLFFLLLGCVACAWEKRCACAHRNCLMDW